MTELMQALADNYADKDGKYNGSLLLDDIMASYELNILPQLEEQVRKIRDSLSTIVDSVPEKVFAELPDYLKEWLRLCDPLLKVSRITGMNNSNIRTQVREIFNAVREKTLALHNDHGRTRDALRLMLTIRWEISEVSAEGISWKGVLTPLDAVSGVSWGGIRQYTNGFHTSTSYKIEICASYHRISLTPNEKNYDEIIAHLWRALAGFLSTRILTQVKNLSDGETLSIGKIRFTDKGVYLEKSGWFSSDVQFFAWSAPIRIYSDNGFLVLVKDKYLAKSSYMDDMNTHILDAMLRHFLSKTRKAGALLSSLLEDF